MVQSRAEALRHNLHHAEALACEESLHKLRRSHSRSRCVRLSPNGIEPMAQEHASNPAALDFTPDHAARKICDSIAQPPHATMPPGFSTTRYGPGRSARNAANTSRSSGRKKLRRVSVEDVHARLTISGGVWANLYATCAMPPNDRPERRGRPGISLLLTASVRPRSLQ